MEPDELARRLKGRLEQWSRDFSSMEDRNLDKKWPPSRWPLGNMVERNLVFCVADTLREDGWNCFFDLDYPGKKKQACDIVAVKPYMKNLWIECKLLYDDDKRLTQSRWNNEFMKDFDRLKGINGAKAYFVLFVRYERDKTGRHLYKKRLKALGIDSNDFEHAPDVKEVGHKQKKGDENRAYKICVIDVKKVKSRSNEPQS